MSGLLHLYVGGATSGKSVVAERKACSLADRRLYIATLKPTDEESVRRVAKHGERRDESWVTVEAGADLELAMWQCPECEVVLLDGLGAWISAMLCGVHGRLDDPQREIAARFGLFMESIEELGRPVVVVSDEVGMGLVPADPVSRIFRETLGTANRLLASMAHTVTFVACGLELPLKSS